jgi:hypothetical protein
LKLNVPRIDIENEGLREVNESKTSAIHMCFVRLQVYLSKSIAEKAIDRVAASAWWANGIKVKLSHRK